MSRPNDKTSKYWKELCILPTVHEIAWSYWYSRLSLLDEDIRTVRNAIFCLILLATVSLCFIFSIPDEMNCSRQATTQMLPYQVVFGQIPNYSDPIVGTGAESVIYEEEDLGMLRGSCRRLTRDQIVGMLLAIKLLMSFIYSLWLQICIRIIKPVA